MPKLLGDVLANGEHDKWKDTILYGVGITFQHASSPPTVLEVAQTLSAGRTKAIKPGDQVLIIGGEVVLDANKAVTLLSGPQGSLVKLQLNRPETHSTFECILMRGSSEYLDLFDECQENKKLIALHNQVIEEGNALVSKMRDYEARIAQDASRIKTLEAEVAKSAKKPAPAAQSEIKLNRDSSTKLSSVESELKSIGRDMKDLLSLNAVRSSPPPTPVGRSTPPPAPVEKAPPSDSKDLALVKKHQAMLAEKEQSLADTLDRFREMQQQLADREERVAALQGELERTAGLLAQATDELRQAKADLAKERDKETRNSQATIDTAARAVSLEAEVTTLKEKVLPTLNQRLKDEQDKSSELTRRLKEAEERLAKKKGCCTCS